MHPDQHDHIHVKFTEFPAPSAGLRLITDGPNNAVWFTLGLNLIGEMKMDGVATQYGTASPNTQPLGIVSGPDNALWFTESLAVKIGRITTHGAISEYPIPAQNLAPQRIAVGPDGNLWFTCVPDPINLGNPGQIGRVTPNGVITLFQLPTPNSFPVGIARGPEGSHSLWFCESNNKIGRITTDGTITEFGLQAPSAPVEIALGPDCAMWFTENGACSIGRITTDGSVKHYAIPSNSPPYGITLGPDDAMWLSREQEYSGESRSMERSPNARFRPQTADHRALRWVPTVLYGLQKAPPT